MDAAAASVGVPVDAPVDARTTILVVDDTPENLTLMSGLLRDHYRVKVATNGERALRVAAGDPQPDLILLDIMMPGIDGYEVCRLLKAEEKTRDIPVIFLTAKSEVEDETHGLSLGAVDYITKPISPPVVMARVKAHLLLKANLDLLRHKSATLQQEVDRRTAEAAAIQDVTIMALASLAETRDNDTGAHIRRTQLYVRSLAEQLRTHPRFSEFLDERTIQLLFKSAPLHDIGKIGIPDNVLLKPDRLTNDEFEVMKSHTALGHTSIEDAERILGEKVEFLTLAKEMAHYHQEKWDGTGYPEGLQGDAIPISARLMALADVYDALISKRIYKPAFSHEKACDIVCEGRGKHFDPDVVDAFVAVAAEFQTIASTHRDDD